MEESDERREYWGREVYLEIEERMLRAVIKRPTLARWETLCKIMADGVAIAANEIDRNLASRGWLCLGAMHLQMLPFRCGRKRRLPLHEYAADEIHMLTDAFMPLAKSFRYYLEKVYPGFDSETGRWGRAGVVEEFEDPLPFFLAKWLYLEENLVCECVDCLFEGKEDESVEEGMVFQFTGRFFDELWMLTDDADAELWIVGNFAGNTGIAEIRKTITYLEKKKSHKKNVKEPKFRNCKKVFVVHGHDELLINEVRQFLVEQSLRPIVLRDEASTGRTIIEKFEFYSHVDYAVVLLTADDFGYDKDHSKVIEKRGRQNVIFEMGYFMGKYGRERMVVLCDEGVRHPGDIDGLVYIGVNDKAGWKQSLRRELQSAGLV